jgi:hypothetical protein
MVPSDAAVGGLCVRNLLTGPVSESQLRQAQLRWDDQTLSREGASIAQAFERSQAQAASAAASVAADMSPIIIDSSDDDNDDAAVAQSSHASRSSPKIGKKRARDVPLKKLGRTSMARDYDPSTHPQPGLNTGAQALKLEAFGRRSNADQHKPRASSVQPDEDDSQGILAPSSSQDADESGSQSSVRADWNSTNGANGAATSDDANDVTVFDSNNGAHGGNAAGRSFAVQADGSALRTDTDANGGQQTSRWKLTAHGQWEKRDSV